MASKKREPIEIAAAEVTIRVYPFIGCKPIAGWIQSDRLVTIVGRPALSCQVDIERPDRNSPRWSHYLTAVDIIKLSGYRNAACVYSVEGREVRLAL